MKPAIYPTNKCIVGILTFMSRINFMLNMSGLLLYIDRCCRKPRMRHWELKPNKLLSSPSSGTSMLTTNVSDLIDIIYTI